MAPRNPWCRVTRKWVEKVVLCRTRPEALLLPEQATSVQVSGSLVWCADQHVRIDAAHAKGGCACTSASRHSSACVHVSRQWK